MLKIMTTGLVSGDGFRRSEGSFECLAPDEDKPRIAAACCGCAVLVTTDWGPSQLQYLALSVPELLAKASSVDGVLERRSSLHVGTQGNVPSLTFSSSQER